MCRSQFVDDIEILFDNLKETKAFSQQEDLLTSWSQYDTAGTSTDNTSGIFNADELIDLLCCRPARDELLDRFLDCLRSDGELSKIADFAEKSFSYSNTAELDREVVGRLFGDGLYSSATRLQTFACCPYKYFARFVLELKERLEFKLKPIDLGVFYHGCLEAFFSYIIKGEIDIKTIGEQETKQILEKSVFDVVNSSTYFTSFCRRGSHNQAIITAACQNLGNFLNAQLEMVRAGALRPAFTEISFGKRDSQLGTFNLKLQNGRTLSLSGKIDRIDLTDTDNKKLAIIFDYKTKGQNFSWQQFFYGLDIQLPLYMLAVRNSKENKINGVEVCGGFYLPIEVTAGKGSYIEAEREKEIFNYKAKGIFNGQYYKMLDGAVEKTEWSRYYKFYISKDGQQYGYYNASSDILTAVDFKNVLEFAEKEIKELAEQILSGDIKVRPYQIGTKSACNFCDFKTLCRFDWQINEHHLLTPVSKTEVLDKARQADER